MSTCSHYTIHTNIIRLTVWAVAWWRGTDIRPELIGSNPESQSCVTGYPREWFAWSAARRKVWTKVPATAVLELSSWICVYFVHISHENTACKQPRSHTLFQLYTSNTSCLPITTLQPTQPTATRYIYQPRFSTKRGGGSTFGQGQCPKPRPFAKCDMKHCLTNSKYWYTSAKRSAMWPSKYAKMCLQPPLRPGRCYPVHP